MDLAGLPESTCMTPAVPSMVQRPGHMMPQNGPMTADVHCTPQLPVASVDGGPLPAAAHAADVVTATRKRRAGVGGTPNTRSSPKMVAGLHASGLVECGTGAGGAGTDAVDGMAEPTSDEDASDSSAPLLGSKLAARLVPDNGTPLGAAGAAGALCCALLYWG